jgi:hypothetical protein
MSKPVEAVVEKCSKIANKLDLVLKDKIEVWRIKAMQMKIKKASVLLQENQKSIWIRTKKGKEVVEQIQKSSSIIDGLINTITREKEPKRFQTLFQELEKQINTLETYSKIIIKEIRKRAMSIT